MQCNLYACTRAKYHILTVCSCFVWTCMNTVISNHNHNHNYITWPLTPNSNRNLSRLLNSWAAEQQLQSSIQRECEWEHFVEENWLMTADQTIQANFCGPISKIWTHNLVTWFWESCHINRDIGTNWFLRCRVYTILDNLAHFVASPLHVSVNGMDYSQSNSQVIWNNKWEFYK